MQWYLEEVGTFGEQLCWRKLSFWCEIQWHLPCTYMNQHNHIARLNVLLSPGNTSHTPDLAGDTVVLAVVQSAQVHFPLPPGRMAVHTAPHRNATLDLVKPSRGTSRGLCNHYSSCPKKKVIKSLTFSFALTYHSWFYYQINFESLNRGALALSALRCHWF